MSDEKMNDLEQIEELEKARTQDELEEKWLTFWLAGQLFGVSIVNAEQIVSMQPITEVPESAAYMKGIINLRGNIIPLIDLRLRLGKPEAEYTDHTCIIINNVRDSQFGFIVDQVESVVNFPLEGISQPPQLNDSPANRYLIGIAQMAVSGEEEEKNILLIDVVKLFTENEMDAFAALAAGE